MIHIIPKKLLYIIPKDFFQVFIFDIISKVFSVLITIMLIRVLIPTEYANVVKFTTLAGLISGVIGSGIALSYIRYSNMQFCTLSGQCAGK